MISIKYTLDACWREMINAEKELAKLKHSSISDLASSCLAYEIRMAENKLHEKYLTDRIKFCNAVIDLQLAGERDD